MKALVGTFNQEKALVVAFSVIAKSSRTLVWSSISPHYAEREARGPGPLCRCRRDHSAMLAMARQCVGSLANTNTCTPSHRDADTSEWWSEQKMQDSRAKADHVAKNLPPIQLSPSLHKSKKMSRPNSPTIHLWCVGVNYVCWCWMYLHYIYYLRCAVYLVSGKWLSLLMLIFIGPPSYLSFCYVHNK